MDDMDGWTLDTICMDGDGKRKGCQQCVSGLDELMAELTQHWE